MATTTADMQAVQAADQTTDNTPVDTAAPENQPNTTPVVTGTPGLLENTVGRAFPSMREMLAQPAVKKATLTETILLRSSGSCSRILAQSTI